jgi:hypothetical protein
MGSPLIVVGEESGESESALSGGWIGAVVGPAAQEGLDEAFGFPVGAGTVRAGAQVAQAEPSTGGGEAVRAIAGAVVGHDAGDFDSVAGVPGDQPSKEGSRGGGSLVSQDFGISQTGGVVDSNVNELPAGTPATLPAVASDAMADDLDAPQLLGVDMDELSGMVSLVAADGWHRVEVLEPREALPGQNAGDGGRASSRLERRSGGPSADAGAIGGSLRQRPDGSDKANDGAENCDRPAPPPRPPDNELSI